MRLLILFTLLMAVFLTLLNNPSYAALCVALGLTHAVLVLSWAACAYSTQPAARQSCFTMAMSLTILLACVTTDGTGYFYSLASYCMPWLAKNLDPFAVEYEYFQSIGERLIVVFGAFLITFLQTLLRTRTAHWPYMVLASLGLASALTRPLWIFAAETMQTTLKRDWFHEISILMPIFQFASLYTVVMASCLGLVTLLQDSPLKRRPVWLSSIVCVALLFVSNYPLINEFELPTVFVVWLRSMNGLGGSGDMLTLRLWIAFGIGSLVWIVTSLIDRRSQTQSVNPAPSPNSEHSRCEN